jgi:biopolymer transport protein ExbD
MRIRSLKDDDGLLLTPLIDMIFLVVVFFMLNATLSVNPAIRVDLPPAYTSQAVIEDQIVVTLSRSGDIYIGKSAVSRERFAAELKQELAARGLRKMILRADEATPYKRVVEIMDLARLSGLESIALVTTKKSMTE